MSSVIECKNGSESAKRKIFQATDGVKADAKELQSRIDELVDREVSHLAEMHDLKMRIAELEKVVHVLLELFSLMFIN